MTIKVKKKYVVCVNIIRIVIGVYLSYYLALTVAKNKDQSINKYKKYYSLMCSWIEIPNEKISKFFLKNNIKSIGIYGIKDIGKHLYLQLKNSQVKVEYFIDQSSYVQGISDLPLYRLEDTLTDVDAIIVTPFMEFDLIKERLCKKNDFRILSIEEVVYGAKML